jgi:DNA-binding transcriptional regulator YhcF (GntR family)
VARQPAGPPAYDRVANDIRLRITTGDLNPGDQLPVESDLVDIYQVSRGTLREALRLLASEGFTWNESNHYYANENGDKFTPTSYGDAEFFNSKRIVALEIILPFCA